MLSCATFHRLGAAQAAASQQSSEHASDAPVAQRFAQAVQEATSPNASALLRGHRPAVKDTADASASTTALVRGWVGATDKVHRQQGSSHALLAARTHSAASQLEHPAQQPSAGSAVRPASQLPKSPKGQIGKAHDRQSSMRAGGALKAVQTDRERSAPVQTRPAGHPQRYSALQEEESSEAHLHAPQAAASADQASHELAPGAALEARLHSIQQDLARAHARCSGSDTKAEVGKTAQMATAGAESAAATRATPHASPASRALLAVTPRVPALLQRQGQQPAARQTSESAPHGSAQGLQQRLSARPTAGSVHAMPPTAPTRSHRQDYKASARSARHETENGGNQISSGLSTGHGPFACAEGTGTSRLAQMVQRLQQDMQPSKDMSSLRVQSASRVTQDSERLSSRHLRR